MKLYTTTISVKEAFDNCRNDDWVFVDCRFFLNDPEKGFQEYQASHIKGAAYAHLNRDLSGQIAPGKTGRHPLPQQAALVETFSRSGIDSTCQVVAYDEVSGHMAAARMWWLLKWAGHQAVAVLDGGLKRWIEAGYPSAAGVEERARRTFTPRFNSDLVFDAERVESIIGDQRFVVVDSRSADRYRGENETIDPVAGHIPGAVNAPFLSNLNDAGQFKSPADLKVRFDSLLGDRVARDVVFYCGSGVTAAHNVLAFAHAGKGIPRLYPGSWSDWITDPERPIAQGESVR